MSKDTWIIYLASLLSFAWAIVLVLSLYHVFNKKRLDIVERLRTLRISSQRTDEDDVLQLPFLERTLRPVTRSLVSAISQVTPERLMTRTEEMLSQSGNPRNIKAGDFLTFQGIVGLAVLGLSGFFLGASGFPMVRAGLTAFALAGLAAYLPWFRLTALASGRRREILRRLPDVMDLLVVCVEAGLSFDMSILRVVERFRGPVSEEFQRVLREIQLGRPRKDALKSMAERVNLTEITSLVNAILQTDQLGVGIANVLRLHADMIRDKRQQHIEELAMKAPIKMLIPLVFFIFPSIFIVLLGPAFLNIMKALGGR